MMVFLRKKWFPMGTYSKLQPKNYGLYMPNILRISKTFNVVDIYLFHSPEEPYYLYIRGNSRSSFFQVKEIDVERPTHEFMETLE